LPRQKAHECKVSFMTNSSDMRRIMKNTLMLYIRMGFIMLVNLFLIRLVMEQLGVEDFGIYDVIAGVVALCSFLSSSMASATQRYFSYALGKQDETLLAKTYSTNLLIYAAIAFLAVFVLETAGIWFVKCHLKLPTGRLPEVLRLFQFSVFALVGLVFSAPFSAILIAHEDMGWYAGVSVLEVLLKLGGVFALGASGSRLVGYGAVLCGTSLVIAVLYVLVCRVKYAECRLRLRLVDRSIVKEVLSFTWWTLFGSLSTIIRTQGVTILLNQFFTPVTVAAQTVAIKIANYVNLFAGNFNIGLYPPLVKHYAAGEKAQMFALLYFGSKITFFLMWGVALPLLLEMDLVLGLWLKEVPPNTVLFARLALVESLVLSVSLPLTTAARAPGRIRTYELALGLMQIAILPICAAVLCLGYPASSVFWVAVAVNVLMFVVRLQIVGRLVAMPFWRFVRAVLLPVLGVVALSTVVSAGFSALLPHSILNGLLVCAISVLMTTLAMAFVGLNGEQRTKAFSMLLKKLGGGGALQ